MGVGLRNSARYVRKYTHACAYVYILCRKAETIVCMPTYISQNGGQAVERIHELKKVWRETTVSL